MMPSLEARDTIYMRIPFSVFDVNALQNLELLMRYDDGFVAYVNGQEMARRNFPARLYRDSSASGPHSDTAAVVYESIDVTNHLDKLTEGDNVLAVHGLGSGGKSGRFSDQPDVAGGASRRGPGRFHGYSRPPARLTRKARWDWSRIRSSLPIVGSSRRVCSPNHQRHAEPDDPLHHGRQRADRDQRHGVQPGESAAYYDDNHVAGGRVQVRLFPRNVDTQTYIFLDDVIHQAGGVASVRPVGYESRCPRPDWEVDPIVVNNPIYSGTIKDDLKAVPPSRWFCRGTTGLAAGGQGIYIQGTSIAQRFVRIVQFQWQRRL